MQYFKFLKIVRKLHVKKPLELERKFRYDFDIEKKLILLGAKKLRTEEITDEYYDNFDSYFMLLNDFLLRSRTKNQETKWQLKYPSSFMGNKNIEGYFEVNKAEDMITLISNLSEKHHHCAKNDSKSIESLIQAIDLKCFGRINSIRKSYLIEDLRVDLDQTDFNYKLGEIEIVLDGNEANSDNVSRTIQKISSLTSRLGLVVAFRNKV